MLERMSNLTSCSNEPKFARCSALLTDTRPIFTHDSKYLACSAGRSVRFYSVISGDMAHEVTAHTDTVTYLTLARHNPRQLVSCGLDGRLLFSDTSDGQVLREVKCQFPIYGVYFCETKSSSELRLVLLTKRGRDTSAVPLSEDSTKKGDRMQVDCDAVVEENDYKKCQTEEALRANYDCSLNLYDLNLARNELTQVLGHPLFTEVSRDPLRTCVDVNGGWVATLRRQKMMVQLLELFETGKNEGEERRTKLKNRTLVYYVPIAHKAYSRIQFECIALHPKTPNCVATGLSDGRILLWWNVAEPDTRNQYDAVLKKKKGSVQLPRPSAKTATLHWHALPVGAVSYTPDGAFLLSGGLESVLVKWYQPESGRLDFLPRLGAPIRSLSVSADGSFYCVTHQDNAITLVQASINGVAQSISGLVGAHRFTRRLKAERYIMPAGLQRDPISGQLVLNGRIGHLQFYDPQNDRCSFQLDIVGENIISAENVNNEDAQTWLTDVACAAFSPRGRWLATAETLVRSLIRETPSDRDPDVGYTEVRLKFWRLRADRSNFELVTCVDMPHVGDVRTLQFGAALNQIEQGEAESDATESQSERPGRLTLASCGAQDGQVRLWRLTRESEGAGRRVSVSWDCVASAAYRETRCVSVCDFSADASLLAAVFDGDVVLFRTVPRFGRLELLTALEGSVGTAGSARSVRLCKRIWSHMLVAYTTALRIYDVLDCACLWQFDLTADAVPNPLGGLQLTGGNQVELFAFDDATSRFAIVDRHNVVTVFDGDSHSPLFQHRIPESVTNKRPLYAVFDSVHEPDLVRIYFATLDTSIYSIEYHTRSRVEKNSRSTVDSEMADAANDRERRHDGSVTKTKTPFELFVTSHMHATSAERRLALRRDRDANRVDERDFDAVVSQLVASPSHTLPNAAVICHSLFTAALQSRPAESK